MPTKKPTATNPVKAGKQIPKRSPRLSSRVSANKLSFDIFAGNTIAYIAVGILIFVFSVYVGIPYYHNKQIENRRILQLKESGLALDKLQSAIDASGINAQTKRLSYCWHVSEKFSVGQRYCTQQLVLFGKANQQNDQVNKVNESINLINGAQIGNNINTVAIDANEDEYSKDFPISFNPGANNFCRAEIAVYIPSNSMADLAGGYYIDIACDAPIDMAGDIYPPQGNVSGLNYLEEYQP